VPTWKEREDYSTETQAEEIVVIIITSIGMLWTLILIPVLLHFWNNQVIRASSRIFLLLILIGSLLVHASVFTFSPSQISDTTCNLSIWLCVIGIVLMFG